MCTCFKTTIDAAQNFIDGFFSTLTVGGPFHRKDFKSKKKMVDGGTGLISEKKRSFVAELNKRSGSSHQ